MLIAQITDAHVVARNEHWLSEPRTGTEKRLIRTIDYLNSMNPTPDVIFFTGDTTEKGTKEAYEHLKDILSSCKIPIFLLPGNHDKRDIMRDVLQTSYFPDSGFLQYVVEEYPLRLIGLDTTVDGKGHGMICEQKLAGLEETLRKEDKPFLIFMHHPPIKIGVTLFDRINCGFTPRFESLLRENGAFLGTITGHYHHLCTGSFAGKPCFLAPSVAPVHYFSHPRDDFVSALELEDPAISLHSWAEETGWISRVVRVKEHVHRIDWKLLAENS